MRARLHKNLENRLQFFSESGDIDAYLVDTLRLLTSEDVGKDESSVQVLIKKHDDTTADLENYQQQIVQLETQAMTLPEDVRSSVNS